MSANKNVLLYGGVAIIVALAVFISILILVPSSGVYSVSVSMKALNYNPNATYPYNNTRFVINVTNTGSNYIKDLKVGFFIDDQAIDYYNVSIPAHKTATINENYTYASNGTYNISAIADPARILDISNNSVTQSLVTINVKNPQSPNLYSFVPYNGTNSTYSFTLFPRGIAFSSILGINYNQSSFAPLVSQAPSILSKVLLDLSAATNIANGVYSTYNNGTSAYGLWLQGTMDNAYVKAILSTYSFKQSEINVDNATGVSTSLSNNVSMCSFSNGGWTKILIFDNASRPVGCKDIISETYPLSEYAKLENLTKENNSTSTKIQNFTYSNSTGIGFALGIQGTNFTAYQISQNSAGSFATLIQAHKTINISSFNEVCPGYIYANNSTGFNMCSMYAKSYSTEFINYTLVKSMAVTPNATLTIYSFVDENNSIAAHLNAAALISKLNVSSSYAVWKPIATSSCSFSNTSIGCGFNGFSANDIANVSLTNGFGKAVHINSISCGISAPYTKEPVNKTIAAGATANASFPCMNIIVPISSAETFYNLNMSYTYNDTNESASGSLGIADFYIN